MASAAAAGPLAIGVANDVCPVPQVRPLPRLQRESRAQAIAGSAPRRRYGRCLGCNPATAPAVRAPRERPRLDCTRRAGGASTAARVGSAPVALAGRPSPRQQPGNGPAPAQAPGGPRCACSPETSRGATRAPGKRPPPASGHGHDQHSTGPGPDGRREPEAPRAGGTGRRQREGPVPPWTDSARHDEGSTLDAGPGCSPRIDPRRRRPGGRRWRVAACSTPRGRGRRNLGGRRGDATPRGGLGRPHRVTVDQAVAFSTRRRRGVMATLSTER